MPITQRRMIAVINSGKAYEFALKYALETIQAEFGNAECGLKTHEEARHAIMIMVKSCTPDFELVKALTFEQMHFHRYGRRNEAEAKRHARRRARKRGEDIPYSLATGGNNKGLSVLDEQWGQSPDATTPTSREIQELYEQWNKEQGAKPSKQSPGQSPEHGFTDGVKQYAPKVLRGNIEVTRTVTRGGEPADPEGPPASVDLEDGDDGGLL